jgi:hypothetical protein
MSGIRSKYTKRHRPRHTPCTHNHRREQVRAHTHMHRRTHARTRIHGRIKLACVECETRERNGAREEWSERGMERERNGARACTDESASCVREYRCGCVCVRLCVCVHVCSANPKLYLNPKAQTGEGSRGRRAAQRFLA